MIKSLHISNYALIDEIDIDFSRGFNIIKIGRASCRERV